MSEFKECSNCASNPGTPSLCPSCVQNRESIAVLEKEIADLKKEIELDDEHIADLTRVLHSIPECVVHGKECIPHAVEWVNRITTLGEEIFKNGH